MSEKRTDSSRHRLWRLALLMLVLVPFLPEIAIYLVTILAYMKGCQVTDTAVCFLGEVRVSGIISALLVGAVFVARCMGEYGIAVVWLALCYVAILLGWPRLSSRLLLGFVILVFALLPYVGPLLSISHLVSDVCQPNEGGVGPCIMFGGNVGAPAHDTVNPKLAMLGVLIAVSTFLIYLIVAIVLRLRSGRRPAEAAQ